MNLKQAKERSIKLWTWAAETGAELKGDWPDWEQYGDILSHCFLCEYSIKHSGCGHCPYRLKFGPCSTENSPYYLWSWTATVETRKKYARLFLEQLKQL